MSSQECTLNLCYQILLHWIVPKHTSNNLAKLEVERSDEVITIVAQAADWTLWRSILTYLIIGY